MVKYRKTIVAVIGAAVTIASFHLGADHWAVQNAIVLLTALGVYTVPNT